MPVKRRHAKARIEGLSDAALELLTTGDASPDPEDPSAQWDDFVGRFFEAGHINLLVPTLEAQWHRHRDAIMAAWVQAHPGTRPAGWWWQEGPDARPGETFASMPPPPPVAEQAGILARLGVLTPAERRARRG